MKAIKTLAVAAVVGLLPAGCATQRIERAIVEPERLIDLGIPRPVLLKYAFCTTAEQAALGPAGERVAYAVVLPRAYKVQVEQRQTGPTAVDVHVVIPETCPAEILPSKGSVVLLHGYGMDFTALSFWALKLAQAGFTTLLVDLPGFGESRDFRPSYGPREAETVAKLIGKLRAEGRLPGPLSLFGVSLGGMEALRVAALVPDTRAAVALAPMRNLEASTWDVIRTDAPWWIRGLLSREDLDTAMRRAETVLGSPLLEQHVEDAVAGARACTLLLRGADDTVVGADDIAAYAARLPAAQAVLLPHQDHDTLAMRMDWLGPPVGAWLAAASAAAPAAPCPRFELPADPRQTSPTPLPTPPAGA